MKKLYSRYTRQSDIPFASETLKECLMVTVRISSSGCTREVAKHEKSVRVVPR